MATMDRFRFGMRDALANGLPLTDALGQGISAAAAADEAGRKKGFQRSITDAIGRGLTARQAIGDALGAGYNTADYGVKGMRKGVRNSPPGPAPAHLSSPEEEMYSHHELQAANWREKGNHAVAQLHQCVARMIKQGNPEKAEAFARTNRLR